MVKKSKKPLGHTQNRTTNISLYPLTGDQALEAALRMKPDDVKAVIAESKTVKPKRK